MSTTRTEERPITGRTVTIELPQAVAARFAQRSPLSSGRDERALIIACQDAVDPAPAIPVAHLDHDALIALAREEISSDRRPSVRAGSTPSTGGVAPMQRFSPERLRSARQATGLRPEASAVAVDRSAITVRFWETGRSVPNANQLAALAELYGTDPSAFYVSDLVGAAYEDEHNARIRSARARCDELGIEWREATS